MMKTRTGGLPALFLALAISVWAVPSQAQAGASGRVIDASTGAPVSGALVVVEGVSGARQVTDADGGWGIASLAAGQHALVVTHLGYADWRGTAGQGMEIRLTPRALPLDAVVITASRRLQRLAEVPVTTELITRAEIQQTGVSDLSRVLIERLGIQVEGNVSSGEGVMLQGMGSQRVLVLLDGQPVVGRVSGMLDISRIPASSVDRIEVVKGPQSSLYGSDAMGGVVNIVTRSSEGPRWRGGLELTAGTEGRADVNASVGGDRESFAYLASLGRRFTNLTPGRSATRGALAERWDAMLKVDWQLSPSVELQSSGFLIDDLSRWRGGALYSFSEGRQYMARVGANIVLGESSLSPTIFISEFDRLFRQSVTEEPVPGTGEREIQRLIEGELLYNGSVVGQAVDGGVEVKREYIESERIATHERALHTVEPFLQTTLGAGRLQIVPGARLVWSEQWGTHFTPRVATLYRPSESVALRASVGLGYRAPDFKELGMEFLNLGSGFGYTVRGNPDLHPEGSENLTLGVEWTNPTRYVRLQGYYNRFDDFIQTELVGDSSGIVIYRYGNVEEGFTRGAEVEGGMTHGGLRVEAGYAWLQAEDSNTSLPLLGRAAHSGRFLVEHPLPFGTRAAVTGSYTGETPIRRTVEGDENRSAFLRLDARIAGNLPGGLEAALGVLNLLDEAPDDWPGFGRRQLYLGVNWNISRDSF